MIMPFAVAALRQLPALQNAQVLAGAHFLTNPVNNLILANSRPNTQHLATHEVLAVTLNDLYQITGNDFRTFIAGLTDQQCSALLVHNTDPLAELPADLITACEAQHLPLLALPYQSNEREVFISITQALYTDKQHQLRYYQQADRHFASLTQSNSRQSLIDTLAALVKNPVVLFQIRHDQVQVLLHSPDLTVLPEFHWQHRRTSPDSVTLPGYFWVPAHDHHGRLVATPLFQPAANPLYLGVLVKQAPLQPIDFSAIESAGNFLKLIITQQSANQQNRQAYTNDLIDDLLTDRPMSAEHFQQTLTQLHLQPECTYQVVTIHGLQNGQPVPNYFHNHPQTARRLIHLLKSHWPDWRYRIHADYLLFIFREGAPTVAELQTVFTQLPLGATETYKGGIGTPQLPRQLKLSANQALQTFKLLTALPQMTGLHTFTELGFYRCLPSLTDHQQLKPLIPENLLQLYRQHPELYQTLSAYLNHNLSIKQSAAALFIHPKTMSYRLGKLRELLHTDFSDAEELFTFNVGLHILQLI